MVVTGYSRYGGSFEGIRKGAVGLANVVKCIKFLC
jgi:hypothetical protein